MSKLAEQISESMCDMRNGIPVWVPSPEEIAAKCEEIRKGWSPARWESSNNYEAEPVTFDNPVEILLGSHHLE